MPLVSVVIPTYNRGRCIERAIESVVAQTHTDLEVIVVDDRSADDTVEVVEAYARKDSRVRLLKHDKRNGAQAARNTGINAARGDWIAFLDSDDEWLQDSLASRLRVAHEGNPKVVHSECYVIRDGSTQPLRYGLSALEGFAYRRLLKQPGTLFSSLLIARECFERIGRLDENIVSYQEWDLSIRLARYYRFGFIAEPTFIYDCRQGDTISRDVSRGARGYEQVFTKYFWPILHQCGPKTLAAHYQKTAYWYAQANDERNARRCSRNAFFCWPLQPRMILHRLERLLHPGV